jgi:phenylpyruvate tautomerase PptA (4-oxalocrotonate tautomerase family)
MPLIDLICPENAFTAEAKKELLNDLWSTALRWEGIEATDTTASIAWVYLDERPRDSFSVGGHAPTQHVYRANVRVMSGFMEQDRIDGMAREITEAVVRADGTGGDGSGPRVFCIVEEIPNGGWSIDGTTWTSVFTARAIGADPGRIAAMERAAAANPRIEVPLSVPASR